jgi:hypothetical protein
MKVNRLLPFKLTRIYLIWYDFNHGFQLR